LAEGDEQLQVFQRMIARKATRLGWLRMIERAEQTRLDQTQPVSPRIIHLPTKPIVQGSDADGQS
jgi:hypothetical protein